MKRPVRQDVLRRRGAGAPAAAGVAKQLMKTKSKPGRRQKRPAPAADETTSGSPASVWFPIVGIGASAGGLEALEQFLRHVPAGSGMGFVIVQHLDPVHRGIMPELLQLSLIHI